LDVNKLDGDGGIIGMNWDWESQDLWDGMGLLGSWIFELSISISQ
jgi:hypothetical protein